MHSLACVRAQGEGKTTFPEPSESVRALLRAKDRAAALEQIYGNGSFTLIPYDPEAIVECGELVPRSMVAGKEPGEPLPDLSEQASQRREDGPGRDVPL